MTSDGTGQSGYGSKVFMITYFGDENITADDIFVDCVEGKRIPALLLIIVSACVVGFTLLLCALMKMSNLQIANVNKEQKNKIVADARNTEVEHETDVKVA